MPIDQNISNKQRTKKKTSKNITIKSALTKTALKGADPKQFQLDPAHSYILIFCSTIEIESREILQNNLASFHTPYI